MPKSIFSVLLAALASVCMLLAPVRGTAQDNRVVFGSGVQFLPQFYSDEVVRNAPVTVRITTRSIQKLHDGNRIIHEDVTDMVRDSRGRVRRENSPVGNSSRRMVSLSDPAEKRTIMLDTTNKLAFKVLNIGDLVSTASISFNAAPLVTDFNQVSNLGASDFTVNGVAPDDADSTNDSVNDRAVSVGSIVMGGAETGNTSVLSASSAFQLNSGQTEVHPLGQQTANGVRLEGTLYRTTYPAGSIGNESPIVVEKTTWFAPDLRMMVRSEENDPRFGTVLYEAEILSTDEPDAALFEIPPDYKVVDSRPVRPALPDG